MGHKDQALIDKLNAATGIRVDFLVNAQEALTSMAEIDRWLGGETGALLGCGISLRELKAVRGAVMHARHGVKLITDRVIEHAPTGVAYVDHNGELRSRGKR
jgi:hypothetical protein